MTTTPKPDVRVSIGVVYAAGLTAARATRDIERWAAEVATTFEVPVIEEET